MNENMYAIKIWVNDKFSWLSKPNDNHFVFAHNIEDVLVLKSLDESIAIANRTKTVFPLRKVQIINITTCNVVYESFAYECEYDKQLIETAKIIAMMMIRDSKKNKHKRVFSNCKIKK